MIVLVLNCGSSSIKYQVIDIDNNSDALLAKGLVDRIGLPEGSLTHKPVGKNNFELKQPIPDHTTGISLVLDALTNPEHGVIADLKEVKAVGHRVAHGGEFFADSAVVTEKVKEQIRSLFAIAPLHNPANLKGVNAVKEVAPEMPQVGVFDTAFHQSMPKSSYMYAIPYEMYEKYGIRRYGFHGTSHRFVSAELAKALGKPIEELKIMTCHLGNGSSITAVDGGKAIDTSMGFTPQEGICMGTRSGTIDPTVVTYLMKKHGYSAQEMEDILNKKSGFLGVSGISNDTRDVDAAAKAGNYRAELSLKILANGIKKHIGAYAAEMNGLDALVFTAGIGENQANIREKVCENMKFLGIEIDVDKNNNFTRGVPFDITKDGARVRTGIIPTDEEYMIALDTKQLCE